MLLIYGNEEAFGSVGAETLAELIRETDALNRELFESGELVGAYGVADQVNAKGVRVSGGAPGGTDGPLAQGKGDLGSFTGGGCDSPERGPGVPGPQPAAGHRGGAGRATLDR